MRAFRSRTKIKRVKQCPPHSVRRFTRCTRSCRATRPDHLRGGEREQLDRVKESRVREKGENPR